MNAISVYFIEIGITLAISSGVVMILRRPFRNMLVDLCRTQERAHFWLVFSGILLVGFPLLFGMGYQPKTGGAESTFFEVANQIKLNLFGFLVALVVIGGLLSFFTLFAPRPDSKQNL